MALILSLAEQQAIKSIGGLNNANTVAESKYTELAFEVERNEITKLIGDELYQDIVQNPANYVDLLEGSTFTYCDRQKNHYGLKYIIAYLNYDRWAKSGHINDTMTGMVEKKRPDSEPISQGDRKNNSTFYRQIAMEGWKLTQQFLNTNSSYYPLWCPTEANKRRKTPVITSIRKTAR